MMFTHEWCNLATVWCNNNTTTYSMIRFHTRCGFSVNAGFHNSLF